MIILVFLLSNGLIFVWWCQLICLLYMLNMLHSWLPKWSFSMSMQQCSVLSPCLCINVDKFTALSFDDNDLVPILFLVLRHPSSLLSFYLLAFLPRPRYYSVFQTIAVVECDRKGDFPLVHATYKNISQFLLFYA